MPGVHLSTIVMFYSVAGVILPSSPASAVTGACCATDGICTLAESTACDGDYLGNGTSCDPNCCPQPSDSGGQCCRDEYRCSGGWQLECDPAGDPAVWPPNCGTCDLVCSGPGPVFDVVVPGLSPPAQFELIDMSSDSRQAEFNGADDCADSPDDGWYHAWHTDACAKITWTYCCNEPFMQPVQQVLIEGCPCNGSQILHLPNPGRAGYGGNCGNDHCCDDENYSIEWTVRAGTFHYSPFAGSTCEQSGALCSYDYQCPPGELCVDRKRAYQAHLYIEPCVPAACCHGESCSYLPKFECEDDGGAWLGNLVPTPVWDCTESGDPPASPCAEGACCMPDGDCAPAAGGTVTAAECGVLGGRFTGGVLCTNSPCVVCDFENPGHCQLDTGAYIYPADRYQGTRQADDFIPEFGNTGDQGFIHRVCFELGFITEDGPECSDDPPRDTIEVRFYEDDFGLPGTELIDTPGVAFQVDRAQSKGVGMRTWRFSGPVNEPTGVKVTSGDCYWIEITGEGDGNCQVLWTHSRDGNNYRLRDDDGTYGSEDSRQGDLVFCVDTGMRRAAHPSVDGGCGPIPTACFFRDQTCRQLSFQNCTNSWGWPIIYGDCDDPEISPVPKNDYCHIEEDPPNPNRPPTGAFAVCTGNPDKPDLGDWIYYDGLTPETRLGECDPAQYFDEGFTPVCNPLEQDCPFNWEPGQEMCWPHQYEAYECDFVGDNRLAATDGPTGDDNCYGDSFQADTWYEMTAPCQGRIVIENCKWQSYDGMLAIFGDHTPTPRCPGLGDDNEDLLHCNYYYCSHSTGVGARVFKDATYIIRMGGWSGAGSPETAGMGSSNFHVGILCDETFPRETPLPAAAPHNITKHRYLSINPNTNPSVDSVLKVELTEQRRCSGDTRRSCLQDSDCKDACDNNLDKTCTSDAQCGGGNCVPTGTCVDIAPTNPPLAWTVKQPYQETAGCLPSCGETDWIAKLAPIADPAHSEEWTGYLQGGTVGTGLIHISDCPVVPCTTYNVYACDPLDISWCSEPLVIETQVMPWQTPRNYGDVAGPTDVSLNITEPDGFTSVVDVFSWVLTKQNYGTATLPQAHPTRMDLHGLGAGIPPDYFLTVSDLSAIYIFGFQRGLPWKNTQGGLEPQNCP